MLPKDPAPTSFVKDGHVITDDADASVVLGITRDSVLQIASDLGVPVDVRPLTLEDLAGADEAFFTGTAIEVTPITEVDGRPVGAGKPGPITLQIQQSYFGAVHGRLPQYRAWLAYAAPVQTTHVNGTETASRPLASGSLA